MNSVEIYRKKVNDALKEFLSKKLEKDKHYHEKARELIENLIEYNLRQGKRIRPIMAIFAYKCFKDDENIINASICMELMQSYLLIHDDIMDKSDLRRGKLAMHKIYSKESDHNGISMGINAGDLCASYIYDSILEGGFSDEEKLKTIEYINWIIEREIYGQTLDILLDFDNITEDDVFRIYELKTATYTMQGPIFVGCILAKAPKEMIKKLQDYAYNIGVAFQIQDDLNGIFSETKEIGKPNDSDAKEGKKTLIIAKTLEICDKEDRNFILQKWGSNDVNGEDIKKIREIMIRCGALDYCVEKLDELIKSGKDAIKDIEIRDEGKNYLLEMADYINHLFSKPSFSF